MLKITAAFLVGICLLLQCQQLPVAVFWGVLLLGLLCLRLPHCIWLGIACLGFCWAGWRADLILAQSLPIALEGKTIQIDGHIVSLVERHEQRQKFLFRADSLLDSSGQSWPTPGLIQLSWYQWLEPLLPGQRWQLTVRLKRPRGFINPGGFDYAGWLFRQQIRATGYVLVKNQPPIALTAVRKYPLQTMRAKLAAHIEQAIDSEKIGLIKALAIGERSAITQADWQILRATGTNHLLAISGLHIGLVAGLVYFITKIIWAAGIITTRIVPATRMAGLAASCAALGYAALAGFAVPTQRALIMLSVLMLSYLWRTKISGLNIICIALFVILLLDPLAVLAIDLWLSFLAVATIAYAMGYRVGKMPFWWRWGRLQCVIAIGLAPLLLHYFQQLALLGVLANLIAVPWVGFIILPCILIGTGLLVIAPTIASLCLQLAVYLLAWLWPLLNWLGTTEFSLWHAYYPAWALWPACIGVFILLLPGGIPARWIGLCWCLPLLAASNPRPDKGDIYMTMLDVGQGLAVVVSTAKHTMIYDVGPKFSARFDAGQALILPYLRQQGIRRLHTAIISHADNDHSGGFPAIAAHIPIDRIFSSMPEQLAAAHTAHCIAGQSWLWDEVYFEIIHPNPTDKFTGNNASCVLQIKSRGVSLLISGDIEAAAEASLLVAGNQLQADVLIVPHHGSKTSSSAAFIDAISPKQALFSTGYKNRFHFPAKTVVQRYKARGIEIWNTADAGAIQLISHADGYKISATRQKYKRLWHAR